MSTINPSALNAYQSASQTGTLGGGAGTIINQSAEAKTGPSFADVLENAAQKTIDTQKVSEKMSADAVVGKADLTEVVNAVNNAEMTLNLFVAMRDKMIDAYNQVTRMQI